MVDKKNKIKTVRLKNNIKIKIFLKLPKKWPLISYILNYLIF